MTHSTVRRLNAQGIQQGDDLALTLPAAPCLESLGTRPKTEKAPTPKWKRWLTTVLTFSMLFTLAIILRADHLLAVSFWFDEACAWRISQFRWNEMFDAITRDAHPPLYYVLQKGWQPLCGTSVFAARSLSFCCGLSAVAAMFFLASTLHAERAIPNEEARSLPRNGLPWLAALLLVCSPMQIALSQQARPYALAVTLSLLAAAFLMRALQHPEQPLTWLAFSLTAILLSFTHYLGLFTLAAFYLFAAIETVIDRCSRQLWGLAGSLGLIQLAWWNWIPVFQEQCARTFAQFWLPPLTWEHWERISTEALTTTSLSHGPGLGAFALLVWIGVPVMSAFCGGRAGRMAACGTMVPVLTITVSSLTARNILEARLLCSAQAFLLLAMALLITRLTSRRKSIAVLAVLGIGLLILCNKYSDQRDWHANHAGLQRAVDSLNQNRQADEPVLVGTPFLFASLVSQIQNPNNVFVIYQGDHRQDVLAGPPLQPADIARIPELLADRPPLLWTVDAEQLFDQAALVNVPAKYQPAGQTRYAESFGIPMEIIVRRYRLPSSMAH